MKGRGPLILLLHHVKNNLEQNSVKLSSLRRTQANLDVATVMHFCCVVPWTHLCAWLLWSTKEHLPSQYLIRPEPDRNCSHRRTLTLLSEMAGNTKEPGGWSTSVANRRSHLQMGGRNLPWVPAQNRLWSKMLDSWTTWTSYPWTSEVGTHRKPEQRTLVGGELHGLQLEISFFVEAIE